MEAVAPREDQVEKDQVERFPGGGGQARGEGAGLERLVALELEGIHHDLPDGGIVFHDEDAPAAHDAILSYSNRQPAFWPCSWTSFTMTASRVLSPARPRFFS